MKCSNKYLNLSGTFLIYRYKRLQKKVPKSKPPRIHEEVFYLLVPNGSLCSEPFVVF